MEGVLALAQDIHDYVQALQPTSSVLPSPGNSQQHGSPGARCSGRETGEMGIALLGSLPACAAAALQLQTGCPLEKGEIFLLCCRGLDLVRKDGAKTPVHLWAKLLHLKYTKMPLSQQESSNLWYLYIFEYNLHDCQLIKEISQAAFIKTLLAKKL